MIKYVYHLIWSAAAFICIYASLKVMSIEMFTILVQSFK